MHSRITAAAAIIIGVVSVAAFPLALAAGTVRQTNPSCPAAQTVCILADVGASQQQNTADDEADAHPAGEPPSRTWLSYLGPWFLAGLLLALALAIIGLWLVSDGKRRIALRTRGLA
jgi:hypothetical protein